MSTATPRIFVSHSHSDDMFTERLVDDLNRAGASAWMDKRDLDAGNFQERISEALDDCEWFVLVLTRDALASGWVRQEVDAANRLKHQKRIRDLIFIQAGPVEHRKLPALWGVFNIFDATADYSAALARTLKSVGLTSAWPESRGAHSPYSPRIQPVKARSKKVSAHIGPSGKSVQHVRDATRAGIDIKVDGTIHDSAHSNSGVEHVLSATHALTNEVEVGKVYMGVVRRLVDFGAFVEFLPGKEGLVLTLNLSECVVNRPEDVVLEGDEIIVMVIEVDSEGQIYLSRKAALCGEMPSKNMLEAEREYRRSLRLRGNHNL